MLLSPTDRAMNVPGTGPVTSGAEPIRGSPMIDAAGHGRHHTRMRSRLADGLVTTTLSASRRWTAGLVLGCLNEHNASESA